ncbi:RNA-directed DNA polymerase, partial [uncultured Deefgea sp.]|uniref:RNA-directed DNA polymerase n=1 Tax=uncultured Deefgea sp. TaxID=1304914 RepID=UPI00262EA569
MGLLAKKYKSLKPKEGHLNDKVVLAQAWKKAHQYIRSTNWYADTFELDRSAIDLDARLDHWIDELANDKFTFEPLRIVPAPKSEQWHFEATDLSLDMRETASHKWCPVPPKEGEKPQALRPLAHVSIRDQSLLMALMMCLANKVESCQGNTATRFEDVHKQKIVNYGNRLYCHYNGAEANFAWGNSTSYSKYFTDYQHFLARPIHFGGEALQQKLKDQRVYEIHLDITKFYDCVDRTKLNEKILALCEGSVDPLLNKLLKSFEAWEWDESSSGIYDQVCKKDDESIPKGIPQGLVIGGFLANIYLLDFDQQIQSLIGTALADGVQLVDYCRYVDDMRLIIIAKSKGNTREDIALIKPVILAELSTRLSAIGLEFGEQKTRIEPFRYKRSGISTKLQEIQSKVSGPLSAGEIDEQLGSLEGLIGLADSLRISENNTENTNSLALIDAPSNDVRDDTLLRFSANKIHKLLKQKRSLVAQEIDANGVAKPGAWDYLQERMARKFISCWSKDPSLVLLLKKGLELFPEPKILKPILDQLGAVIERKEAPIQQKMAQYCLGEIFRDAATTIHTKDSWAFPAHANVAEFFEQLQTLAVEIVTNTTSKYDENLIAQAMFFCLVRNDSPLDQDAQDENFNIITKMMKGHRNISVVGKKDSSIHEKAKRADFIANALLAYQLATDKLLVIRSVNSLLDKVAARIVAIPKDGLTYGDVLPFCKSIAVECPIFFAQLVEHAKGKDTKWHPLCKELISKLGLSQSKISGDLSRFNKDTSLSLLSIIKRTDNPFAHENAALALLFAVLNGEKDGFTADIDSTSDEAVELQGIIDLSNCKVKCDNWSKIQSLEVPITIGTAIDFEPIFPLPDWIEPEHLPLYRMGIFLRSCLIGNTDWSAMRVNDSSQAKYMGLKSSFIKRQLGMMHSPEALNGETAPMSNWVSSLLFH